MRSEVCYNLQDLSKKYIPPTFTICPILRMGEKVKGDIYLTLCLKNRVAQISFNINDKQNGTQ